MRRKYILKQNSWNKINRDAIKNVKFFDGKKKKKFLF